MPDFSLRQDTGYSPELVSVSGPSNITIQGDIARNDNVKSDAIHRNVDLSQSRVVWMHALQMVIRMQVDLQNSIYFPCKWLKLYQMCQIPPCSQYCPTEHE